MMVMTTTINRTGITWPGQPVQVQVYVDAVASATSAAIRNTGVMFCEMLF